MWKQKLKRRINNAVLNVEPALDKLGVGFHKFYNMPHKYIPYLEKTFKQRTGYWFNMFIWTFLVVGFSMVAVSVIVGLLVFLIETVPTLVLFVIISAGIVFGLASILKVRE